MSKSQENHHFLFCASRICLCINHAYTASGSDNEESIASSAAVVGAIVITPIVMTNVNITRNDEHQLHSEHLMGDCSMLDLTLDQSNKSKYVF